MLDVTFLIIEELIGTLTAAITNGSYCITVVREDILVSGSFNKKVLL
jgi:hypothetical protein